MSTITRNLSNIAGANVTNPDANAFKSTGLEAFANDAAFVAANTPVAGSLYWNTTTKLVRQYNGTTWQNDKTSFETQNDSTTTGALQTITPSATAQIIRFTQGALTSIRDIVPINQTILYIVNGQIGINILLKNEEGTATAANRIVTGTDGDLTLKPGQMVSLAYDSVGTRWRVTGGSGGGGSLFWGDSVASFVNLPATGVVGEVRQILDSRSLVRWNGSYWVQAGNVFNAVGEIPSSANASGITLYQTRTVFGGATPVFDIAEGNNTFIAVSGTTVTANSPDTYAWTASGTTTTPSVRTIAFGNGIFVATSNTGSCTSSDNGATWTANVALPAGGTAFGKLYFMNGFFIIVGNGGYMATSPNGTTWTQRTTGIANQITSVAYSSSLGLYVAVGGVAGTTTNIITSPDLVTWTPRTAPVTNQQLYGIAWGGTIFAAAGGNGTILTSSNGTTWTSQSSGTSNQFWDIVILGNFFFAFELSNSVRWSAVTNGVTWTNTTSTTIGNVGIVRGLSRMIAVGDQLTNFVMRFSRSNPSLAYTDQTSGIGRTDTGESGFIEGLVPVAQFGTTGAIIRGQTNAARLNTITTALSLKIGEPIKFYNSTASTSSGVTVGGIAASFGTNYGLYLLQATAKFTGTIPAVATLSYSVGLGAAGWSFHSTGSSYRTGENAGVFKLEAGSAVYTMTTTFPSSVSTPMVLVQYDATNGFTLHLPNGNIVFAGSTLSVSTRVDGTGMTAMTRETYLTGYRVT
jgi:hypothetical protein